ncbi:hypothetical protein [Deinococcus misasensis]|uniref:hypothetical protein n=1 Tax=Deinococcus misasensis TaxID=392413 RepID=UPI0005593F5A|nr:hypothetical protein [Deinococcus misasensis]
MKKMLMTTVLLFCATAFGEPDCPPPNQCRMASPCLAPAPLPLPLPPVLVDPTEPTPCDTKQLDVYCIPDTHL